MAILAYTFRRYVLVLLWLLLDPARAFAEVSVPIEMQVELMKRVVRFERGFGERAASSVHVLLVVRKGHSSSERAADRVHKALSDAKEIAGKPLRITQHPYTAAAALRKAATGAQIVYLTSGLEEEITAIASQLQGVPVITVTTDGEQVDHGAVLGFELVSSRPKIALNLGQAKKQGLDFNSDLFRLARIVK